MRMAIKVALGMILLLLTPTGCVRKGPQKKDLVLAIVGDKRINESDFRRELERLDPSLRSKYRRDRMAFLNHMLEEELIYREAVEKNLAETREAKKRLARAEEDVAIEELKGREIYSKVSVTRKEIEERYREEATRPGGSSVVKSVLYVSNPPNGHVENLAEMIRRGLEDGLTFQEIAKRHSLPYESIEFESPRFSDLPEQIRSIAVSMGNKTGVAINLGPTPFYFFKDAEPFSSCFRWVGRVIRDERGEKALREWLSAQRAASVIRAYERALEDMNKVDEVVAEVNGAAVTVADVARLLEGLSVEQKNRKLSDKKALLAEAIDREILRQQAWKRNFREDKVAKEKAARQARRVLIDLMVDEAVSGHTPAAREESRREWLGGLRKAAGAKVFAENVKKLYVPSSGEIRDIFGGEPL